MYRLKFNDEQKELIEFSVNSYRQLLSGDFSFIEKSFGTHISKDVEEIQKCLFPEGLLPIEQFSLSSEITSEELLEIIYATEFISRFMSGDIRSLSKIVPKAKSIEHLKANRLLVLLKNKLFPEFGFSTDFYGFYSESLDKKIKKIFDIYQEFRYFYSLNNSELLEISNNWELPPKFASTEYKTIKINKS